MGNPTDPIAITGATGFIGRALCRRLRQQGRRVRALVRNPGRATELEGMGVEMVAGDLANRSSLEDLLHEANALVHCAGAVRGNSQRAFDHTNVDGTRLLMEAARAAAVPPRFLLLSSIAAREPELSWYAHSKRAAEDIVLAAQDLERIILRPPAVYGPGDQEMLPIFKLMKQGIAPVPGSAEARTSLLHVDDLVQAIISCLEVSSMPSGPFTPTDPREEGYDWHEMSAIAAQIWKRRVRLAHPPRLVLDSIAWCNLKLSGMLNYSPMLTPPKLRELRHPDWVASAQALSDATGWTPRIDLETGLAELAKTAL